MSGQHHVSESECPSCGHDAAIVRVRGNAFSSVCEGCGRADVTPLLDTADLLAVEGERFEAELFELEAVRTGQATPLSIAESIRRAVDLVNADADGYRSDFEAGLQVELRLPVPPR